MLDNPVGTACGFALDIGQARFFFTPGVPRELRRMLEEQIIPRLLARSGAQRDLPEAVPLLRPRQVACGPVADRCGGLVPDGSIKLGFRAHYPQFETKLTVRGTDLEDIHRKLAPVTPRSAGGSATSSSPRTIRRWKASPWRRCPAARSLAGGNLHRRPDRRPHRASAGRRKGFPPRHVSRHLDRRSASRFPAEPDQPSPRRRRRARANRRNHALAVLIDLDEGADRMDFGGTIWMASPRTGVVFRRSRILGGREWVRLGAVELALDCLRRFLRACR